MSRVSASLEGPSQSGGFSYTFKRSAYDTETYLHNVKRETGSVQLRNIAKAHSVRRKVSQHKLHVNSPPFHKDEDTGRATSGDLSEAATNVSADGQTVFIALRKGSHDVASALTGSFQGDHTSSNPPLSLPAHPQFFDDAEYDGQAVDNEKAVPGTSVAAFEDHWAGDKPENELSDQLIRDGYTSKSKVQNELGTARTSLWPHLKGGSSLTSLSSAFLLALQQRQERDNVTTASTFKPPPRVTLTDARKTAWLAELADESVPLRRLSRTIPHGVRGRVLLEQCLRNQIPVSRAMWLIKCVGANELRAFRRKGVSDSTVTDNENRWVAEWTGHIERFLAEPLRGTDPSCSHFQYAINLTARIYDEGLLDRDHFLTWLYGNVENTTLDDLPCILVQLRCWLGELTWSFKHAYRTRIACARKLLDLRLIKHRHIFHPIIDSVEQLMKYFIMACPLSFLDFSLDDDASPKWKLPAGPGPTDLGIEHITKAASEVLIDLRAGDTEREASAHFAYCLEQEPGIDPVKLDKLLSISLSSSDWSLENIATGIVEWAASNYCFSESRVLAGAHLLQRLVQTAHDAHAAVVKAVGTLSYSRCISGHKMARLVAEAVRLQGYDVGRYLRWLVSTGALEGEQTSAKVHTLILRDVPRDGLSAGLSNLLSKICVRQGVAWDETRLVSTLRKQTTKRLTRAQESRFVEESRLRETRTVLPSPVKFQVARELLGGLKSTLDGKILVSEEYIEELLFILEELGDITTLVEALELLIPSAELSFLPLLAETVTHHRDEISALGKLEVLRALLVRQYHMSKRIDSSDRSLLDSLLVLATASPRNFRIEKHIQRELDLFDQRPGIAAQTPMSEGLANDGDITDKANLEPVYASFKNLPSFEAVCAALAESGGLHMDDENRLKHLTLATKASLDRLFDSSPEECVATFTSHLIVLYESGKSDMAARICRFSLTNGLLSLKTVVAQSSKARWTASDSPGACMLALELLDLVSIHGEDVSSTNGPRFAARTAYEKKPALFHGDTAPDISSRRFPRRRFALQLSLLAEQNSGALIYMLAQLIQRVDKLPDHDRPRLQKVCGSDFISSLVSEALSKDDRPLLSELGQAITDWTEEESRVCCETLLSKMMDPQQEADLLSKRFTEIVQFAIETTNACSAPIHRFCLPRFSAMRFDEQRKTDAARSSILDTVHRAISEGKLLWSTILDVLPAELDVFGTLRAQAEAALLARHDPDAMADASPLSEAPSALLLDVVRATSSTIPNAPDESSTPGRILEALEALAASDDPQPAALTNMLHLALLHRAAFPLPPPDEPAAAPRMRLLAALARFIPPARTPEASLPQDAHALAAATLAFFALDLPPAHAAALLPANPDPTLRFLLSVPPPPPATPPQLFLQTQPPPAPALLPAPFALPGGIGGGPTSILVADRGVARAPFARSAWELVPDAGGGDEGTAIGLRLFGARRVEP